MQEKDLVLRKIANTLYLNVQKVPNGGLLNGKLGIALFLYEYAKYSGQSHYQDFGDSYIDVICDSLHENYLSNFSEGMTGIAWTLNYLMENNFLDGDSDDILEDIDARLKNIDYTLDLKVEIPLFSAGLYFLARGKHDVISEIILNLDSFLSSRSESLPISYLNSALFFLVKAYELDINQKKCVELITVVTNKILNALKSGLILEMEKVTCYYNFVHLNNINIGTIQQLPVDIFKFDNTLKMQSCWTKLLYLYDTLTDINLEEVDNYVNNTITNLRHKDLLFYGGLTGLGWKLICSSNR